MNIALIKSVAQFKLLSATDSSVENKVLNIAELSTYDSNMAFFDSTNTELQGIEGIIASESKYIPVVDINTFNMTADQVEQMSASELIQLTQKISTSWTLGNNLKFIANSFETLSHLKKLWVQDRDGFFEELWQIIKTNLNTSRLQIIFNDLKEPTEKQKEKGARNQLYYAVIKGEKKGQIFEAKEPEIKLMQEYDKDFAKGLNITEQLIEKKQLVFNTKIGLSPLLFLCQVDNFTPLQSSILECLFNGLAEE